MDDFDKKAKDWDSDPVKAERAQAVAEAIRKGVPLTHSLSALEYGCGTGLLGFALQPYLSHITLADASTGMLAILKEKIAAAGIGNMTPLQLDLSADPLPKERYGLICTLLTLHHIPDTEGILKTFHALLENDGYLCISDLDKEDGSFHGEDFHGHNGFDRQELRVRLERAGFANISFSTVYHLAKETGAGRRSFPLFLMVAQKV